MPTADPPNAGPRHQARSTSRLSRLLPPPGPTRLIAVLSLVNSTGNGAFYALSALYFTRIVGLPVLEVALGLSIAGIAGLVAGIPVGHLADRRGPREILVLTLVLAGIADGLLLLVTSYWQFVVMACVFSFATAGASAVRNALIAALATGAERSVSRAYVRAVTNVGTGLGTALAALALHADDRPSYIVVMLIDVVSYVLCAFLAVGLPKVSAPPREEAAGILTAVRDLPYLTVTGLSAVLALHYEMLAIGVPLWVVNHTSAPKWLVSVLLVLNTVVVVTCQVAVARRIVTLRHAITASAVSGLLLFESCVVFGLSSSGGLVIASLVLVAALLLQVVGEITQAASSFVLGFDLAPEHAQGQYQGLFGSAMTLSALVGPTVIAVLPLRIGPPGWWVLGALMLVAGLLLGPAARWAERSRARADLVVPRSGETPSATVWSPPT
ncbi:MFS transporter [Nocardioides mangrovicus]|uniref:MFS transporter n=1 Tax=Nocardioides mangrovicus TaxID=2478913 RepID=UPI0013140D77|nr:MFS transporter [Nocardioides mangrovicus]